MGKFKMYPSELFIVNAGDPNLFQLALWIRICGYCHELQIL
jgi:hypothetical protein